MAKAEQTNYRKALRSARMELKAKYRERDEIERHIARLRQTVQTLGMLCGDNPQKEYLKSESAYYKTLTDAVVSTILTGERPLQATEIRDILEDIGYEMPSSNPLASIHSVLKRLWQQRLISVAYVRGTEGALRGKPSRFGDRYYWYTGDNWKKAPKKWITIEGWGVGPGGIDLGRPEKKKKETAE